MSSRTLLEGCATEVRRQWLAHEAGDRELIFDVVWRARWTELRKSIPESIGVVGEVILRKLCEGGDAVRLVRLTNVKRLHWHKVSEALGLDHTSTGSFKNRTLVIQKHPGSQWCWEFTDRPAQRPTRPRARRPYWWHTQEQEDRDDAHFQVYYKYCAWGYKSPEEMMEHEPEIAAML